MSLEDLNGELKKLNSLSKEDLKNSSENAQEKNKQANAVEKLTSKYEKYFRMMDKYVSKIPGFGSDSGGEAPPPINTGNGEATGAPSGTPAKTDKVEDKNKDLNQGLIKQGEILMNVRAKWKEMTGAVIGSFYTLAKLSPLFASYISEFGGVLGYVYDTAIIPWSDEIEGLLDKLWAMADWFDSQSETVKKFAGAVMIAIPVITGIAVAVSIFLATVGSLASGGVISAGIGAIMGFLGAISVTTVGIVALIAVLGYLIVKYTDLDELFVRYVKNWIDKFKEFFSNVKSIAESIYSILKTTWDKMHNDTESIWYKMYQPIKNFVEKVKDAIGDLIDYMPSWLIGSDAFSMSNIIVNASGGVADYLSDYADSYSNSYATGGSITQDGIYKLHQGETVIPASQSSRNTNNTSITISPNVTINGSISSSLDIRKIADEMSRYWKEDIKKYAGGSLR